LFLASPADLRVKQSNAFIDVTSRSTTPPSVSDSSSCGGIATGNSADLYKLAVKLRFDQGEATVAAGGCLRLGCSATSGIYVSLSLRVAEVKEVVADAGLRP
jgi:hypothetical protein